MARWAALRQVKGEAHCGVREVVWEGSGTVRERSDLNNAAGLVEEVGHRGRLADEFNGAVEGDINRGVDWEGRVGCIRRVERGCPGRKVHELDIIERHRVDARRGMHGRMGDGEPVRHSRDPPFRPP